MFRKKEPVSVPSRGFTFTRFVGDLDRKRILLISTAGVAPRLQTFEEPEAGYYLFSSDVATDDLFIPHHHFGHEFEDSDIESLFPIERLRELQKEGFIGGVTEQHVSIYGFHFLVGHVRRKVAPEIAELVESFDAGAAVIIGGCLFCHRIAAVVQRAIEERGIPTVSISHYPRLSQYYQVSRIFYPVGFRLRHPIGPASNPSLQRKVLKDALSAFLTITDPVTVVEKEYPEYEDPKPRRSYRKTLKELRRKKRD